NCRSTTAERPPLRHYTPAEAEAIIEQVEPFQRRFEAASPEGYPYAYLPDEWYSITGRDFPPAQHYGSYAQIENGVGMTRYLIEQWASGNPKLPALVLEPRRVTLVTSTMARPVIEHFPADL